MEQDETERFRLAWRKWKSIQLCGVLLLVLWLPMGVLVSQLLKVIIGHNDQFGVFVFVYFSLFIANAFRVMTFLCPACDQSFSYSKVWSNPWRTSCGNCGAKVGSEPVPKA